MWSFAFAALCATLHPVTGAEGVLAYTLHSESSAEDMLSLDDVVEVDRRLKAASSFASDLFFGE